MNDEKLPLGSPAAKHSIPRRGKSPVTVNTATVVGRAPLEPRGAKP